jgi:hypothetical protein
MKLKWNEETARRVRDSDPTLTELDLSRESATFLFVLCQRSCPASIARVGE